MRKQRMGRKPPYVEAAGGMRARRRKMKSGKRSWHRRTSASLIALAVPFLNRITGGDCDERVRLGNCPQQFRYLIA